MIVQRMLRQSLKKIGVVDIGTEPSATEYEDALESANSMLKTWAAHGLIIYHIVTETLTLVQGQGSYTIGAGANFDTVRPNEIVGGFIRDANGSDTPFKIISRDTYNEKQSKTIQSIPRELYYYPSYPNGIIYFVPVPNAAYTLSLDSLKPLTELTLDADLNMPPEYEEAIIYNLAIRLAPDYNVPTTAEVVAIATHTYNLLSVQPVPVSKLEGTPGYQPKPYNISHGA